MRLLLALCLLAADDSEKNVAALAPAAANTFLALHFDGGVTRHDPSGELIETLGPVPTGRHHVIQRIEAVAGGAIAGTSGELHRVHGKSVKQLLGYAELQALASNGYIIDFAFDEVGDRGVIVTMARGAQETLLIAFDRGKLRTLTRYSMVDRPVRVAVDLNGRWAAVVFGPRPLGTFTSYKGGPLAVFELATGRKLWEQAQCESQQYFEPDAPLQFTGDVLVACGPWTNKHGIGVLAGYDATTGRVRWQHKVDEVYARSAAALLVNREVERQKSAVLDIKTGELRPLGVSWLTVPHGGVLLDGDRVATVDKEARLPRMTVLTKPPE